MGCCGKKDFVEILPIAAHLMSFYPWYQFAPLKDIKVLRFMFLSSPSIAVPSYLFMARKNDPVGIEATVFISFLSNLYRLKNFEVRRSGKLALKV